MTACLTLTKEMQNSSLEQIALDMEEIASMWYQLRSILMKSRLKGLLNADRSKLFDYILGIADHEKKLVHNFQQIDLIIPNQCEASMPQMNMKVDDTENLRLHHSESLDLSKHFNNKVFQVVTKSFDGRAVNISEDDQYFILRDTKMPRVWKLRNMIFQFPETNKTNFDNISCHGQRIDVKKSEYDYIMVLGCSLHDTYSGNITLHYADVSHTHVLLTLHNWDIVNLEEMYWAALSMNANNIAWIGDVVSNDHEYSDKSYVKRGIMALTYRIKKKGILTGMTLPNCPNMHIFAITLAK